MILTGRAQADLTGQRLKQLDLPYTALISSTMTRALETAKLVNKHMPELILQTDDSLREGAPIPPEPPIGGWRPEPKVGCFFYLVHVSLVRCSHLQHNKVVTHHTTADTSFM